MVIIATGMEEATQNIREPQPIGGRLRDSHREHDPNGAHISASAPPSFAEFTAPLAPTVKLTANRVLASTSVSTVGANRRRSSLLDRYYPSPDTNSPVYELPVPEADLIAAVETTSIDPNELPHDDVYLLLRLLYADGKRREADALRQLYPNLPPPPTPSTYHLVAPSPPALSRRALEEETVSLSDSDSGDSRDADPEQPTTMSGFLTATIAERVLYAASALHQVAQSNVNAVTGIGGGSLRARAATTPSPTAHPHRSFTAIPIHSSRQLPPHISDPSITLSDLLLGYCPVERRQMILDLDADPYCELGRAGFYIYTSAVAARELGRSMLPRPPPPATTIDESNVEIVRCFVRPESQPIFDDAWESRRCVMDQKTAPSWFDIIATAVLVGGPNGNQSQPYYDISSAIRVAGGIGREIIEAPAPAGLPGKQLKLGYEYRDLLLAVREERGEEAAVAEDGGQHMAVGPMPVYRAIASASPRQPGDVFGSVVEATVADEFELEGDQSEPRTSQEAATLTPKTHDIMSLGDLDFGDKNTQE